MQNVIENAVDDIRQQVGADDRVICGLSGGVDSSVTAALVHRAIGDRLVNIFVDNGLCRRRESEMVETTFHNHFGMDLRIADARERFLFKFGQKGGSTGKLSRPQGIAVDSRRGRIYVVDYMRHTVNVYSRGGIYLYELGGRGWGPGWFNYPTDVAVDERGYLLVADLFNQRVQVLEVREEGAPPGIGLQ